MNENYLQNEFIELKLPSRAVYFLAETAKWAKLLSVLGFIFVGVLALLLLIGSFFVPTPTDNINMDSIFGSQNTIKFQMIAMYIVMLGIYIVPLVFLYRFATYTKKAIADNNVDDIAYALSNQKSFFKFFGVLSIIFIAIYAIMAVIFGIIFTFVGF